MAEKFVEAASMFVTISQVGESQLQVYCLVSITRNYTTNVVDAGSMCNPTAKTPGTQDISVDMTLQRVWDVDPTHHSERFLHNCWTSKSILDYTISTANPQPGELVETGEGYITSMTKNDTHTDRGTMDITITCTELPVLVKLP